MSTLIERLRNAYFEPDLHGTLAQTLNDAADELERLTAENAKLKTVMTAAAEEIAAHWDAHCDAEGYGPQNLLRRLEEGIASEYGYTAGAFAALKAENARLREACAAGWGEPTLIKTLTAECDALRADAERLDWLEAHPREGSMRFDDGTFKSVKSWAIAAAPEVSLRAAIDAARTQAHKDAPEPFTCFQKGVIAGDGKPCLNDHDPDCRWPDCICREREAREQATHKDATRSQP